MINQKLNYFKEKLNAIGVHVDGFDYDGNLSLRQGHKLLVVTPNELFDETTADTLLDELVKDIAEKLVNI